MADYTITRFAQDPKNPEVRFIEIGDVSADNPQFKKYLLSKEQFAQLQNAGLNATYEYNPRLDNSVGNLDSFDTLSNLFKGSIQKPEMADIFSKASQLSTFGAKNELADNPGLQAEMNAKAYGGQANMIKSLGEIPNSYNTASKSFSTAGSSTQNPDDLVWVQKGPNQLQMSRSAAQSQGLSEIAAPAGQGANTSNSQQTVISAGQLLKPSDLAAGTSLKEGDIARTTGLNIYRRDLAKEQNAMTLYAKTYGAPSTDSQWRQFHDYVYEGKVPGGNLNEKIPEVPPELPSDKINSGDKSGSPILAAENVSGMASTSGIDNLANSTLQGVERAIYDLKTQQQTIAQKALEKAQSEKASAVSGFTDVAIKGQTNEEKLKTLYDKYEVESKMDKLNEISTQMKTLTESLRLGMIQEGDRIAPMGYIGRSQTRLQNQAAAQMGMLSVAASVIQGDLDKAKYFAGAYLEAFQADNTQKIASYKYLIDLADKDIVSLKEDEKTAINDKIKLLQDEQTRVRDNAEKVTELILKYPSSSVKGKVTMNDTLEEAVKKMQPYLSAEQNDTKWTKFNETTLYNTSTAEFKTNVNKFVQVGGDNGLPVAGSVVGDGECGSASRAQFSEIADGEKMGDTLESKTDWVKKHGTLGTNGIAVGDEVITDGSDVSKNGLPLNTGHAFIVTGFDGNGKMTIWESNVKKNASGVGVVSTDRTLPIDSQAIVGYVRGTLKNGLTTNSGNIGGETPSATEVKQAIDNTFKENNAFGGDNKISWESYLWAYQNWLNNKKSAQSFYANFPMDEYLDENNMETFKSKISK